MPRCRPVDRGEGRVEDMDVADTVGGAGAGAVNIIVSPEDERPGAAEERRRREGDSFGEV